MKASKQTIENISNNLDKIKNVVCGDIDKDLTILIINNVKDREIDDCTAIGTPYGLAIIILGFLENNPKVRESIAFILNQQENNDEK